MRNAAAKICLMLAGSNLTRKELRLFCHWVDSYGARRLEEAVLMIRRQAENLDEFASLDDEFRISSVRHPKVSLASPEDDPVNRIQRLLLGEANLSGIHEFRISSAKVSLASPEDDPVNRIQRLLLGEANLSGIQASNLLYVALRKNNKVSQKKSKDSFSRWIRSVAKIVPYSVLLHEATKIRNRVVHSPAQDWPLRNKK